MKVYRLNEYDWVYAKNADQAVEWYMNETGLPHDEAYDENYFEEIDPSKGTMLVDSNDLTEEEKTHAHEFEKHGYTLCVRMPYEKVVNRYSLKVPCIIATTEW